MAGLARDVDLGILGFVRGRLELIVLSHVGGVALGAHAIPVLVCARPVEWVEMVDAFVGIEVKPPVVRRLPVGGRPRRSRALEAFRRERQRDTVDSGSAPNV
jgi:hypothetical protein